MYYLLGGSGVPNYGDELMAAGWLRYLAREKGEERVVIDTNLASVSTLLLQQENWRASHVSVVRNIANIRPREYFWQNFERGYKFFARGGILKHARLSVFDDYLRKTKVFHMFGGGYISNKWPASGFLLGFAGAAQAEYGFKIVATGLGLTPISHPPDNLEREARRVLSRFSIIELRDPSSFKHISEISGTDKAFFGLDDSFLEPVAPLTSGDPNLHVSCFMNGQSLVDFIDTLSKRKNEIEQRFSSIKFWMCAPHRDQKPFEKLKEVFPSARQESLNNLINGHQFGKEDVMITTRFHPHMIAARAGIRGYFAAVSGDYYADKHGSVTQLGSTFRPFSDFGHYGFDLDPATKMAKMDTERVSQKRALAAQIYS